MIIVTAGHVDHGKTALLQAITGTNTAHLPEEKRRGLTIDLGYAYLPLADRVLGFIDVPGHQKFLSNMLAGLGGVRYALLVVSAEEGIKPQTETHLALLKLLDFAQIMVVITKSDRADKAQIEQLGEQIRQRYPFLANSPVFVTSAKTLAGIASLKAHLLTLSQDLTLQEKPFRYAIDRVFNVKGVGLVVTGIAVAGKVSVGDWLYLSTGEKVRVKNIHAQNQPAEQGVAGERLALNIANVEKSEVQRGDWITELPVQKTDRIAVKLTAEQALKESNVVHLYHYASHITGKLTLLNAKQAVALGDYFAEIVFDEPLSCVVADKLIVRNGDDSQTLAGARVLELNSPKRYKRSETHLAYLADIAQAKTSQQRLACDLRYRAVGVEAMLWREQVAKERLMAMVADNHYLCHADYLMSVAYKTAIEQRILAKMDDYHQQHPDQLGVSKARLHRLALLEQPVAVAYSLIDSLLASAQLQQTRGWLHRPAHRLEFSLEEQQQWAEIRPLFEATHHALWVRDIATTLDVDETRMRNLLYKAGKLGYIVPIVKDRFLLHEQVCEFAERIKQFIAQQGDISVNQLRDELHYGRKLTVQLIEYFDRSGFLRRRGNVHLLRDSEAYSVAK